MTDEKKNTSPDDEYQFPQDEYSAAGSEHVAPADTTTQADTGSAKKSFAQYLPQLRNKRILLVIALVILLIVVFRIVNTEKAPALKPVQTQPVAEEAPPPSNDNDMLGSLNSLRAHTSRTESQIKDLQGQVADMQSSLNQSQEANQALQKSVADLTSQMQGLSTELNNALEKLKPAAKTPRIVFHLRAVIPDRAWIIANTGETESVTVGDHIKQYGTVRSIDAQSGLIETSSGRKIGYGTNDY